MSKGNSKEVTFDQAMERLQEILEGLQSEKIGVDDLADQMKEASKLVQFCKKRLHDAEMQVKEVMKELETSLQVAPDIEEEEEETTSSAVGPF